MLCDLRTQMNQEKHLELAKQKDMLKRGHDAEFQALMQEHEEALQRFVCLFWLGEKKNRVGNSNLKEVAKKFYCSKKRKKR